MGKKPQWGQWNESGKSRRGGGWQANSTSPAATSCGGLVKAVQRLVTVARKAEVRTRKATEDCERIEAEWAQFQDELKKKFIKGREQHRQDSMKAKQTLEECQGAQTTAFAELQEAMANPEKIMEPRTQAPPPEVDLEWDALLQGTEDSDEEMTSAAVEQVRSRLREVVASTPPRRPTVAPLTPLKTSTAPRKASTTPLLEAMVAGKEDFGAYPIAVTCAEAISIYYQAHNVQIVEEDDEETLVAALAKSQIPGHWVNDDCGEQPLVLSPSGCGDSADRFDHGAVLHGWSPGRFWDVFDVQQVVLAAVVPWLGAILVVIAPTATSLALSVLLALLVGLRALLLAYGRKRHPFHRAGKGTSRLPLFIRPLLAFGLFRCGVSSPMRIGGRGRLDPRFLAHQRSEFEQLVLAESQMIWSQPLMSAGAHPDMIHRQGPPVLPPAGPEPLDEEEPEEEWPPDGNEPIRARHVSLWVLTPFSEPEMIQIAVPFPTTLEILQDFVRDAGNESAHVSPVVPQIHEDFASFLLLPDWLPHSSCTAVALDARLVGGGIFAHYLNGPLTRSVALQAAGKGYDEPFEVFVGGDLAPLGPIESRLPVSGSLVKVVPRGTVIEWSGELRERLDRSDLWDPRTDPPPSCGRGLIAFQSPEEQYIHHARRDRDNSPLQVAAWAFGLTEGAFRLRAPTDRPVRLCWKGASVHSLVAVVPRHVGPSDTASVIFLDLRGVGHWPQWTTVDGPLFHPGRYVEDLQIELVEGFSVVVQGGRIRGEDGYVEVQDGEVLEIVLRQTATLTPTQEGSSGASDDEEDDDCEDGESSSTFDALPDSSDFSEGAPNGPGPWGPPPPEPVNAPRRGRSRSPARRGDTTSGPPTSPATISIAAELPVPTYDLTIDTLKLPSVPPAWTTHPKPWPPTWLHFHLGGLPLKEATTKALAQTVPWPELLARHNVNDLLEIELYTDGSANKDSTKSGFAITILLRVGLCVAVFGVISDQLLGASSVWPLDAPPALRAEQVAITVAMLWIMQFRGLMPSLSCTLCFDCMSAGYAASGRWQAPDQFGEQGHLLELFLREQPGLDLHFAHVRAHEGNPWIELSDVLAKEASIGRARFGVPPVEVCREFLTLDLSWLAIEAKAACSQTYKVHRGCLEWGAFRDDGFRLRPDQLVPVQGGDHNSGQQPPSFELTAGTLNVQGFGGKTAYLEAQLDHEAFNVIMFQETKSPMGLLQSKRYLRLHSESLSRWGTAIWIHRQLGLFSLDGRPTKVDEHDLEVQFEDTRLLILKARPAQLSIYLIAAHCPHALKGPESMSFLDVLETELSKMRGADLIICGIDLNGRVPALFGDTTGPVECGEPDLIGKRFVTSTLGKTTPSCTRVDQNTESILLPLEDHRLVGLTFSGTFERAPPRAALWRPQFDRAKIASAEGRQILLEACRNFVQPKWEVTPDEHCQMIQDMLLETLQKHFLVDRTGAKATYIPLSVWELREAKMRLKRATRGRLHLWSDLVSWAFRQWHTGCDAGLGLLVQKQGLLCQLTAAAIRFATARIRKGVAEGRQRFIGEVLGEGHHSAAQLLRRAKAAGFGGAATRQKRRPLPALLDPASGQLVGHRAGKDQVWLEYFGQQEQGCVLDTTTLVEQAAVPMPTDEVQWTMELLPTLADVQRLMRTTPRHKSAGLDLIPGDVLSTAHEELAAVLHPLFTKAMLWARQPTQWTGGILFEAFKNAGSNREVSNYRSLFVSSALGKLGCATLCCFWTPRVHTMLSAENLLLVTFVATPLSQLFQRFNLPPEDLQELMATVSAGGIMDAAGVPPALRQVIRDFHYNTWFTTRFTDGRQACKTLAGSRPGESFADTIFGFVYAKLLCSIYEVAATEGLAFEVPYDPETGVYADGTAGLEQTSWDGTWADDSAFITVAADAEQLLHKATRLCEVVIGSCQAAGLTPNMKVGKTSLLMRLSGRGSVRARRQQFRDGASTLRIAALDMTVPLVPQYRHLDGFLDVNNTMVVEARHRVALATQAFDDSSRLFLCRRDLSLETRAGVFNTIVTTSLFNMGLWVPGGRAWKMLNNAYSRLVRRLLAPTFKGDRLFRVPLVVAHVATGCWKLDLVARRARLSLLASLVVAGPDLLWATLQAEGSWLKTVRGDLEWPVGCDSADWPRLDAAGWPAWFTLIRDQTARFKRRVALRLKATHKEVCASDVVLVCQWAMFRTLPKVTQDVPRRPFWKCWMCGVSFDTKAKLSVHYFKTHKREFWSNGRLAAHLRAYLRCVESLRRSGCVVSVEPGFGSRRRRKQDVEQYTPAAPVRVGPTREPAKETSWGPHLKNYYRDLCEAALDVTEAVDFEHVIKNALACYPLYPDEICDALSLLVSEMEFVFESDVQRQWSRATLDVLQSACRAVSAVVWSAPDEALPQHEKSQTFEDFQQLLQEIRWDQELKRVMPVHGTQPSTLYVLPSTWEAEWGKSREVFGSSAVLDDPLALLPPVLKDLWQELRLMQGRAVQLRAPAEFWQGPLAGPFQLLREHPCIN
ncbi:Pol [Symbiodinium sp. CCMP2592]|nr:Pol [Symbiodinium sp. CCMP2592]